jgi:hypothetical protein
LQAKMKALMDDNSRLDDALSRFRSEAEAKMEAVRSAAQQNQQVR